MILDVWASVFSFSLPQFLCLHKAGSKWRLAELIRKDKLGLLFLDNVLCQADYTCKLTNSLYFTNSVRWIHASVEGFVHLVVFNRDTKPCIRKKMYLHSHRLQQRLMKSLMCEKDNLLFPLCSQDVIYFKMTLFFPLYDIYRSNCFSLFPSHNMDGMLIERKNVQITG